MKPSIRRVLPYLLIPAAALVTTIAVRELGDGVAKGGRFSDQVFIRSENPSRFYISVGIKFAVASYLAGLGIVMLTRKP
jgi:hypothetical protein